MLYSILLIIDVLLAIGLIVLILLQHGKGADAGAAFGSGASATVFGARGSASFLSRTTAALATLFFINSLSLAFIISHQPTDQSVTEQLVNERSPDAIEEGRTGAPGGAKAGTDAQTQTVPGTQDQTNGRAPTQDSQPQDVPR